MMAGRNQYEASFGSHADNDSLSTSCLFCPRKRTSLCALVVSGQNRTGASFNEPRELATGDPTKQWLLMLVAAWAKVMNLDRYDVTQLILVPGPAMLGPGDHSGGPR